VPSKILWQIFLNLRKTKPSCQESLSLSRILRTRMVTSLKLTHLLAKPALKNSTTRRHPFLEHSWSRPTDWPVKQKVLAMEPTLASTWASSTLTTALWPVDSISTSNAPLATIWSLWAHNSKIFRAFRMLPLILDSEFTAVKIRHSLISKRH
jgi:hypothetical protein